MHSIQGLKKEQKNYIGFKAEKENNFFFKKRESNLKEGCEIQKKLGSN